MHDSMAPRVIDGCRKLTQPPSAAILTIGNFDGVHLGHQHIIQGLVERAKSLGGTPCLLTFDPPPSRVVGKKRFVPQITSMNDRQWLCGRLGLPIFVVEPFTEALAARSPAEFVSEIIESCFAPVELWVGYDFAFGKNRAGDIDYLRQHFADRRCVVRQVDAIRGESDVILSSTRVRQAVLAGNVEEAARFLGRPHFLRGTVVTGDQRGRTINFPTANLACETELLPENGVYSTWASVDGVVYSSVTNVGRRPTVGGRELRVECHLLDFDADIYGREITVWFDKRLRAEQKFDSFELLEQQIRRDAVQARQVLSSKNVPELVALSTTGS